MAFTIESDGVNLTAASGTGTFPATGGFRLSGGVYSIDVGPAGGTGTCNIQKIQANGDLINMTAAVIPVGHTSQLSMSPGLYQLVIATAGVDCGISKVLKTG
jgi:hypothetical protein